MAIKKKASKKRVAKKKVVASKKPDALALLREQLKAAKDEIHELKKEVKNGDRKVNALLKLLDTSQADVGKFLVRRVKDAVAKYEIALKPKKRRRKAKKKVAVKKEDVAT
ncbi:MAG: hypothetical protein L3J26_12890 [Candidatus Polarisedimenticolaceae bacterium]|nr:hypothetical protein [Candidatus Polarisedimenticolaceae bacterium]